MKKSKIFLNIFLIITILLLISSIQLFCQIEWSVDDTTNYLYRDNTEFSQGTPSPQPYCDCKDMIRPGKKKFGQTDDEIYLIGGKRYTVYNPPPATVWECQEINLILCTCNGNDMTQLDFHFPYDLNNSCLNNVFRFATLNDDIDHSVDFLSPGFVPNQSQFTSIDIDPPIQSGKCEELKM